MPKYPFSPEMLDALPEELAELFRSLENTLLEEICSRLKIADNLNEVTVQDIRALRSLGIDLDDIKKAISETSNVGLDKLNKLFDDVVERNQQYYSSLVDLAEVTKPERYVNATDIDAIRRQTKEEFTNLTQSMGFLLTKGGQRVMLPPAKAYQWALDNAEVQIMSGGISYREAIKNAVKQLADSGIKTVDYESGHVDQIDVAVRRAVMTGVNQICDKYTVQSMEYLETDYCEVSAHIGARDVEGRSPWSSHKKWQGRVYSIKAGDKYPNIYEVCGLGYVDGLEGANCRHKRFPFIDGVSERTYTDYQLEHIDDGHDLEYQGKYYTAYAASQQQRKIERTVRKLERLKVSYQANEQTEAAQDVSIRIRRLKAEYKNFSEAAGLPEQPERMKVLNYYEGNGIISSPINKRNSTSGKPQAISIFDVNLNRRQARLLSKLGDYNDRVVVEKKSVNMKDLAALTAKTGVEYAMFTKKSQRLIVRGNSVETPVDISEALELKKSGYRWSGHTHPGDGDMVLMASGGDLDILKAFNQSRSVIYNSMGRYSVFKR